MELWKREDLGKRYLEGVRSAIPLAEYQIKIMFTLIEKVKPRVKRFLDLGCGDGILGRAILSKYPEALGVFLDFSNTMIEAAVQKAPKSKTKLFFVNEDFGNRSWINSVAKYGKFDVIVSGFAIHHQTDKRKKGIYREIFNLLTSGGLFLNLEHVTSPSPWLHHLSEEFFIDSVYKHSRTSGCAKTRKEIARGYYSNPLRKANILAPVETQCSWLKKIGFKKVDCYLKIFEFALFGGVKSKQL